MGLSVVSAMLIIVTALAIAGASVGKAAFQGIAATDRARAELHAREVDRRETRLEIASCCAWTGIILRTILIEVDNRGVMTLNASKVVTNVLIDGVLKPTSDITSATIGGATTNTWAPGDRLTIAIRNVGTAPTHVGVVGSNGATALWRPV